MEFSKHLLSCGFLQSSYDHCLVICVRGDQFLAVFEYIDDILLNGTSISKIQDIKQSLDNKFTIKNLGPIQYFLEIEIHRNKAGTYLSHCKYLHDMLDEAALLRAKLVDVPLTLGTSFSFAEGAPLKDANKYCRLVGKLLYLNFTCPDISFVVNNLS